MATFVREQLDCPDCGWWVLGVKSNTPGWLTRTRDGWDHGSPRAVYMVHRREVHAA